MENQSRKQDFADLYGKRVLLALSGGADSMALLHMLVELRDAGKISALCAAHYGHGIRGHDADLDADFCRNACALCNVPYDYGFGSVPEESAATGEGLETVARRMRYRFLETIRQNRHADVIALAHHADDQAETVLMHLLRGAGVEGAQGMLPSVGHLVRPLLSWRKRELTDYLLRRGLTWREDATNAVPDNPRNILRLQAMPVLETAYAGATEALCRHAEIVRCENDYFDAVVRQFLAERQTTYPFGEYIALHGDEQTAVLRRVFVRLLGKYASWERVTRLTELARDGGAWDMAHDLRVERTKDGLYCIRRKPPQIIPQPLQMPETVLTGIGSLTARVVSDVTPIRNDPLRQRLDPHALQHAVLRTRRNGDVIHPYGMTGAKSLSDYLTDKKYPKPLRDWLPVLAVDGEILWAIGLGISRYAALHEGASAIELQFTQEALLC